MNRDKLEVYVNPHNLLTRIKLLEQGQKQINNYFNTNSGDGIQGGQEGSQQGKTNSPGVDTTDIVATYVTDFTQDGATRYKITVHINADKVRGFMGYAYRIYGWNGDVQEYKNYVNSDTLGFTDFTTFFTPVSSVDTSQTINVAVKALNSIYGDSDWSGLVPVVLAKDTTPPATPSAPTVSTKIGALIVTFSPATEADYAYTEIWVGSGSGFTTGTGTKMGQSSTGKYLMAWDYFVDTVAAAFDYVKIRHLDKSGNASALSTGTNVTSSMGLATVLKTFPYTGTSPIQFQDDSGNLRGTIGYEVSSTSIRINTQLTPVPTSLTLSSAVDASLLAVGNVTISGGTSGGHSISINGQQVYINNDVLLGQASGTTANSGFVWLGGVSGVPTGTPDATLLLTYVPLVWDTVGGNLYYYKTGWKKLTTGGTVTSVGLSLPAELTVSGSPVTTSGTLSATWATQSANRIFAGPTSGIAATPAFRALVAADIPSLAYVTSVALSAPSEINVSGSPITSSGTLTLTWAAQSPHTVFAGGTGIVNVTPTFRSLVVADLPAHASTHVTGGSDVIANVVAAGNSGLMTGSDKTKLDNSTITSAPITSTVTVAATATETTVATLAIAANTLTAGRNIFARLLGRYSTANSTDTFTWRLRLGGLTGTIIASGTSTAATVSKVPFVLEADLTILTLGSSGTAWWGVNTRLNNVISDTHPNAVLTINTTVTDDLVLTIQWSAGTLGDTFSLDQGYFRQDR